MSTYYIDYNATDDSGAATKGDPWKRCPGMVGFSGSYSHSAGDRFVFKGGVTWPNTVFPMTVTQGGSGESTRDYYEIDATWYTGGSWSRPVWDLEDTETTGTNRVMEVQSGLSYITVDNIEVENFYWTGATSYGNDIIFKYNTATYITYKNMYVHSWTHGTTGAGTTDDANIFQGYTSAPLGTGCIIEYCIADGSRAGDSMYFNYGGCPIIRHNTIHDIANGIQSTGVSLTDHLCYGNTVYNIVDSFETSQHENNLTFGGPGKCYDNVLYQVGAGMCLYVQPGWGSVDGDQWVYNNLVYNNTATQPFTVDPEYIDIDGTLYIFNNTVEGGVNACFRVVNRSYYIATIMLQNNHWITTAADATSVEGTVNNLTETYNLKQTQTEATAEGYVLGNQYAPGSTTGSTVNQGTSKSAYFTTDRIGITRPQGADWDIGAYEYAQSTGAKVVMILS